MNHQVAGPSTIRRRPANLIEPLLTLSFKLYLKCLDNHQRNRQSKVENKLLSKENGMLTF